MAYDKIHDGSKEESELAKNRRMWQQAAQVLDPEAVATARRLGMRARDVADVPPDYRKGWELAMASLQVAGGVEQRIESVVYAKDIADWWIASGWRARVERIEAAAVGAVELATRSLALAESVERKVGTAAFGLGALASMRDSVNRLEQRFTTIEGRLMAEPRHGAYQQTPGTATSPPQEGPPPRCITDPAALTDEQLDKIAEHLAEPDETRQFQVMVDAVYDITCPEEVGVDEWHEVPAALKVAVRRVLPDELLHDATGTPIDEVEPIGVNVLEVVPDSEIEPPPTEPVELPFEVTARHIWVDVGGDPRSVGAWLNSDGSTRATGWVLTHHQATYAGIRLMTAAAKVRRALAEKGGES